MLLSSNNHSFSFKKLPSNFFNFYSVFLSFDPVLSLFLSFFQFSFYFSFHSSQTRSPTLILQFSPPCHISLSSPLSPALPHSASPSQWKEVRYTIVSRLLRSRVHKECIQTSVLFFRNRAQRWIALTICCVFDCLCVYMCVKCVPFLTWIQIPFKSSVNRNPTGSKPLEQSP